MIVVMEKKKKKKKKTVPMQKGDCFDGEFGWRC